MSGRILTVGNGQQFGTLKAAVAASQDGDTIDVQAGTYTNDITTVTHSVTIEGVGGLAHFQSTGLIANGKAILIDDAASLTIKNLEFSGAKVGDDNGAGIRYEAGDLTVINSYFHDNQDGILGGAVTGGHVTIDGSTFLHNGNGDGQTHGVYVGTIQSLTVTNSFFQDQIDGSDVKSRAAFTDVEHNRFIDTPYATTNYEVDLPNGGNDTVSNNVMLKSGYADNAAAIHFGGELANAVGTLLVQNNQFFSIRDPSVVVLNQTTGQPMTISGNGIDPTAYHQIIAGDTTNGSVSGMTTLKGSNAPATTLVLPTILTSGTSTGTTASTTSSATTTSPATDTTATVTPTSSGGSATVTVTPAVTPAPTPVAATVVTVPTSGASQQLDLSGATVQSVSGLTGDHVINVGGAGAQITATSGHDLVTIQSTVTGSSSFSSLGGDHTVTAAAGNNTLTGGGGNNVFSVSAGNNVLAVSSGNNSLSAHDGNDTLLGGSGQDTLSSGGSGSHLLAGGSGNVVISAAAASDLVLTGSGNSVITLGSGADSVIAAQGFATITGGNGQSVLDLVTGGHHVTFGSGMTNLFALSGSDTITATNGQSLTLLADGTHTMNLGTGSDTLYGIAGSDTITGGSGAAVFDFIGDNAQVALGSGQTTIYGGSGALMVGMGTGHMVAATGSGISAFVAQGGDDIIVVAGTGSVVVQNYDPTHVHLVVPHGINGQNFTSASQISVLHDDAGDAVLSLGQTAHGPQVVVLVGVTTVDPSQIILS